MRPSTTSSQSQAALESAAFQFAETSLGPISQAWVEGFGLTPLRAGLHQGLPPEDAVLRAIHGQLGKEAGLEEEFIGYFLSRLLQVRMVDLYPGLRRFLDTGDLVQSVLGDLWPKLRDLEFRDQSSFLALLVTRLRWKAGSRRRDLHAAKRQEGRRDPSIPLDALPGDPASPLDLQVNREETERAAVALFRLPKEDQEAIRLHLAGSSSADLAEALGVSIPAARKRLERALRKLQGVLGSPE